jgi:hypothetical protein
MKRWITGVFAAAVLAAAPAWAHSGGHGHGRGHGHHDERHGGKHWKHHGRGHFERYEERDVVVIREPRIIERQVTYIEPQPVFVQQPATISIIVR